MRPPVPPPPLRASASSHPLPSPLRPLPHGTWLPVVLSTACQVEFFLSANFVEVYDERCFWQDEGRAVLCRRYIAWASRGVACRSVPHAVVPPSACWTGSATCWTSEAQPHRRRSRWWRRCPPSTGHMGSQLQPGGPMLCLWGGLCYACQWRPVTPTPCHMAGGHRVDPAPGRSRGDLLPSFSACPCPVLLPPVALADCFVALPGAGARHAGNAGLPRQGHSRTHHQRDEHEHGFQVHHEHEHDLCCITTMLLCTLPGHAQAPVRAI